MKFTYFALARRYAQAFLNVFYPAPQQAPLEAYEELLAFLRAHPSIVGLIANCPCPHSCYDQLEDFLVAKFNLSSVEKKLFHRLLLDHHIDLLTHILEHLVDIEHTRRGELVCTIELSHKISDTATQQLIEAFEGMTKLKLLPKILIKPNLICGVRMYTKTSSYERSINKSLNDAKAFAITKGGLW